jgi:predicted phage-related endonuclease
MFSLDLLPRYELESFIDDYGRTYKTPYGDLPSVTTIIGNAYDKTHLEEWRDRLGHEKADAETAKAGRYGTKLHDVLERYLLNEEPSTSHAIEKMRFESVKRKIAPNISTVFGVEFPLCSFELKTAGRADAIVKWKGENAILDLKTTKKWKREEWVEHYFVQACCYGNMVEASHSMNISKIVIVFSTEDFDCYYFEKNISDYNEQVRRIFIENR